MSTPHLRLMTYNIRKGKGASGRSLMTAAIGEVLPRFALDLLLCQEVFHGQRHDQSALLSDALGMPSYYKPNKHRAVGHHGNATFTAAAVRCCENFDISTNSVEKRGALYCVVELSGQPVHVFNVHLGLNHRQRVRQIEQLQEIIAQRVPDGEPALLAGDFNDWNGRLDTVVRRALGFENAFAAEAFKTMRTWHSRRPVFNLDRVYVRGLHAAQASCLAGEPWNELSDHLPLLVELRLGR
jgi:endonuclease/exonuclease/phosphatase family metal-dependent hydrolase